MQLIKHVCQMLQELLLVSLGWKIFSQSHLRIINVVLTPQSKSHMQEGNARITIIASGKGRIKIQMSLLKLRVRAIRKVSFLTFADRKSTRLNSSHVKISYAVFCLKKKKIT